MGNFINKAKRGNSTYPINDARLPETTEEDIGKVPVIGQNGSFEYAQGGGDSSSSGIVIDLTESNIDTSNYNDSILEYCEDLASWLNSVVTYTPDGSTIFSVRKASIPDITLYLVYDGIEYSFPVKLELYHDIEMQRSWVDYRWTYTKESSGGGTPNMFLYLNCGFSLTKGGEPQLGIHFESFINENEFQPEE